MAKFSLHLSKRYLKDLKLARRRVIYIKDTEIRIISLQRTGTHSDLFGKNRK